MTNEDGEVVAKFFHDSYKKRDSPELLIGAALGETVLSAECPRADTRDEDVGITAALHGGPTCADSCFAGSFASP